MAKVVAEDGVDAVVVAEVEARRHPLHQIRAQRQQMGKAQVGAEVGGGVGGRQRRELRHQLRSQLQNRQRQELLHQLDQVAQALQNQLRSQRLIHQRGGGGRARKCSLRRRGGTC